MIEISIPGFGDLCLEHLVLDYNGTLACDGEMIPGVGEALALLAERLELHVVTADTFNKAGARLADTPCRLVVLPKADQDVGKLEYVDGLGRERTVAIGNGRNDRRMLDAAALGIAVIEGEGAASQAMAAADVVCPGILSALELLTNPLRLTATLRS
jgi:soluble P-type ATPase